LARVHRFAFFSPSVLPTRLLHPKPTDCVVAHWGQQWQNFSKAKGLVFGAVPTARVKQELTLYLASLKPPE
jgi:hypothetical protein